MILIWALALGWGGLLLQMAFTNGRIDEVAVWIVSLFPAIILLILHWLTAPLRASDDVSRPGQ